MGYLASIVFIEINIFYLKKKHSYENNHTSVQVYYCIYNNTSLEMIRK